MPFKNSGDWTFACGSILYPPDGVLGFVYLITAPSGMKYVGKKLFYSSIRRKPLKGTKRHRRDQKESDWRKYFGSSNDLLAELARTGPEGWTREILCFAKSKWALSYLELKEQLARDVIMRDDYWNGLLHIRLRGQSRQFYLDNGFAVAGMALPRPRKRNRPAK